VTSLAQPTADEVTEPVAPADERAPLRMVALMPAHNEAAGIGAAIEALLSQTRPFDDIVIIGDNCTDDTVEIARRYPVTVIETAGNQHRKSGALNMAWRRFATGADIVVTVDADTELDTNAVADWEAEFLADDRLGGSTAKFTMRPGKGMILRWQRFEFATSVDVALRRKWTAVLAGAGAALRNEALRDVMQRGDREGPWTYASTVEDFELTHRLRERGWSCHTSPTIRAFTDPMPNVSALWGQRVKWTSGTAEDLMSFGLTRLTFQAWCQQAAGALAVLTRVLWVVVAIWAFLLGAGGFSPLWILLPAISITLSVKRALRIPYRDWRDVALAALVVPQEVFTWLRVGWFASSWWRVLVARVTRRRPDYWAVQYSAERG
jgi:cellulose synthase/poly-beta-1,6-N-acetylglucosamine synthase-like glycosyltransferase